MQWTHTLVEQHDIELEKEPTAIIILTPHPMVTCRAEWNTTDRPNMQWPFNYWKQYYILFTMPIIFLKLPSKALTESTIVPVAAKHGQKTKINYFNNSHTKHSQH